MTAAEFTPTISNGNCIWRIELFSNAISFRDGEKVTVTTGYLHAFYQTSMIVCAAGYGKIHITYELKVVVMGLWVISKITFVYFLGMSFNN